MSDVLEPSLPIVITGASSGIGEATCAKLLQKGVEIIGVDKNPGTLPVTMILGDLASDEGIKSILEQLPEQISGLMNIAGVPGTASDEVVLAVNIFGLRTVSEAVANRIAPGGFILNLSSNVAEGWESQHHDFVKAFEASDSNELLERFEHLITMDGAYKFSKKYVRAWTQYHASKLISRAVRVNSVSPGPVDTPILDDFKNDHGKEKVDSAAQLLGRFGHADDVANVLSFLASVQAKWINGSDIRVDGGLSAVRSLSQVFDREDTK